MVGISFYQRIAAKTDIGLPIFEHTYLLCRTGSTVHVFGRENPILAVLIAFVSTPAAFEQTFHVVICLNHRVLALLCSPALLYPSPFVFSVRRALWQATPLGSLVRQLFGMKSLYFATRIAS